jgi:hypothetical protein
MATAVHEQSVRHTGSVIVVFYHTTAIQEDTQCYLCQLEQNGGAGSDYLPPSLQRTPEGVQSVQGRQTWIELQAARECSERAPAGTLSQALSNARCEAPSTAAPTHVLRCPLDDHHRAHSTKMIENEEDAAREN